jgi:hypothetical protein
MPYCAISKIKVSGGCFLDGLPLGTNEFVEGSKMNKERKMENTDQEKVKKTLREIENVVGCYLEHHDRSTVEEIASNTGLSIEATRNALENTSPIEVFDSISPAF